MSENTMRKHAVSRRTIMLGAATSVATGALGRNAKAVEIFHGAVIGKNGWLFLVWDDPRKFSLPRINLVVSILKNVASILKTSNIELVMLFVPSKARLYKTFLPDEFSFSADAEKRYNLGLNAIRQNGLLTPDVGSLFSEMRNAPEPQQLWFKVDTHWEPCASEAAAALVGKEMNEKLHLPPASRPGSRLGKAVIETHSRSDLASFLPSDVRMSYPDEKFAVHREIMRSGPSALLDEGPTDVVVVGSSYMQPKYNFAPALSSQLNRPVSLSWHVHTVGPYSTLLQYLKSDLFKRDRPKTIVWNFLENDLQIMPDDKAVWLENTIKTDELLDGIKRSVQASV